MYLMNTNEPKKTFQTSSDQKRTKLTTTIYRTLNYDQII